MNNNDRFGTMLKGITVGLQIANLIVALMILVKKI